MARCFDQIVGHSRQVEQMKSALERGRVASTLLFVGPSGVGKKLCARALAQALVCERGDQGCGLCPPCLRVASGQSESMMIIEPEGTQIKMDQARQVMRFINVQGMGRAKVIIVDQAHLLNAQAANALLKSLEEPPANTYFILVANSVSGLLPTIRSRSQILRFGALTREQLEQVVSVEDWVLDAAQGRVDVAEQLGELDEVRDEALGVWRQWLAHRQQGVMASLAESIKDKNRSLYLVRLWQQLFRDVHFRQTGLTGYIHGDHLGLIQELSDVLVGQVGGVGVKTLQLEKDILANADRSLAFEDYFIQLQENTQRGLS